MKGFYLIKRTYGNALFLHPFHDSRTVSDFDQQKGIRVYVSDRITESEKENFLYAIYAGIDASVNRWIQELKYIPRFINAAAVFLVVYFFMSFVIRDPIPVLDELLVSGAAAVGVYLWTAARNRKSDIAMKKRIELKRLADESTFTVDSTLKDVEELLKQYDEMSAVTLADKVCGEEGGLEQLPGNPVLAEIQAYLENLLKRHDRQRAVMKRLPRVNTDREKEIMSAHLLTLSGRKRIDLPLIALFRSL